MLMMFLLTGQRPNSGVRRLPQRELRLVFKKLRPRERNKSSKRKLIGLWLLASLLKLMRRIYIHRQLARSSLSIIFLPSQGSTSYSGQLMFPSLTQAFDDQRLEIEVTKYFSQFGTVFVKIRRDSRHMPFAFCQFTVSRIKSAKGTGGREKRILLTRS